VACFGLVGKPEVCAMILYGVKQALLVLPFCFVTGGNTQSWLNHSHVCPLLGKQNKSKDGLNEGNISLLALSGVKLHYWLAT